MEIELSLAGDESGNGEIIEDVRVRHSNGAPAAIRSPFNYCCFPVHCLRS